MSDWPIFLGSLPGWLTAGSVTTMLGLWLRYLKQRRDQDGVRLTDLEGENRQLRVDFDGYRKECVAETDHLRDQVRTLESKVAVLERAG